MAAGTLYHAWFESIDWLDGGIPTEQSLRATAEMLRLDLPAEAINDLDRMLATFCGWLENPAISGFLRRSAYKDARQPGFPAALASIWKKMFAVLKVERERRFSVVDGDKIWDGSLDRIVWLGDGERIVAADVIDFKTDAIEQGDAKALKERTEHYRPQVEAYRRVVARMAGLAEDRIAARLVFTFAGKIVDV
jgi:ATP-dependent exoDNAse (exonuclease V) beta subunit